MMLSVVMPGDVTVNWHSMWDDGMVYFFDTVTWLVSAKDASTLNDMDEDVDI